MTLSHGLKPLFLVAGLYPCWLAMMTVHEAGHVLHAWLSGGTVSAVQVPLVGFSMTEFSTNPHPHFVAWGGPVWGSLLPLMGWVVFRTMRWSAGSVAQFFAGFCLIANGVYLGIGWVTQAGDAGDIVHHGTPIAVLVGFGLLATGTGLYLWHDLGKPTRSEAFQAAAKRE